MKPSTLLVVASAAALASPPALAQNNQTSRVNVSSLGAQALLTSERPSITADGTEIVFVCDADNLVPEDDNGVRDIYVHDIVSGLTERASVGTGGVQGNRQSLRPGISTDGRFVVFQSDATNLVPGDTNNFFDIFVRDRQLDTTERISVGSAGNEANADCLTSSVSTDGRFVVYLSSANNLVAGDTNGAVDVFVRDTLNDTTERVSVDSSGNQANGNSVLAPRPSISTDGSLVVFASEASNLVPGDTNGEIDIFVRNTVSGTTTRVSVDSIGTQANGRSGSPVISADGKFVCFDSEASNLVPGDTNNAFDIFVHELSTGTTTRVSVDSLGNQADKASFEPSISSTGGDVSFQSNATNLISGDTNGLLDVYKHDRTTGRTTLISVPAGGGESNNFSRASSVSFDGSYVVFESRANNLVPNDTNGATDIFIRDPLSCTPTIVTYCTASTTSIAGCVADVFTTGTPGLQVVGPFTIESGPIPGGNLGITYFGLSGPAAIPIGTQGGLLCAQPPVFRSVPKSGGGTNGNCDGNLSFTLDELQVGYPNIVKVGATMHAAIWFRDPPAPDGASFSNAVWFTICP